MKKYFLLLVLTATSVLLCQDSQYIKVITFNIRYDNPTDGDNAWANRKENVPALVKYHEADLIGFQEVLHSQLIDLQNSLTNFSYVGVGREDGKQAGEYSPVFYNTEKFEKLESGNFWLCEDPEKPAPGWDAACIRICTWVKLKEKSNGKELFVFNTHFDHKGEQARIRSSMLIKRKIKKLSVGKAVVLMGDFNTTPDTKAYKVLISDKGVKLTNAKMVSENGHYGPVSTWTGWKQAGNPGAEAIDYIFVSNGIKVLNHATLTDSWYGNFPSDHLPVAAKIQIK